MKTCKHCSETKPKTEFYRSRQSGYSAWCKNCHKESTKKQTENGYFIQRNRKNGIQPRAKKTGGDLFKFTVRSLHGAVKRRSNYKGHDVGIDQKWVSEQLTEFCNNNYHVLGKCKHPFQPSIDKLDPSKPYTTENCRIVWLIENYCRNTFTDEEVIEFCKRKLGLI